MRDRLVAAGSVVVLLVSGLALVQAIEIRRAVSAPWVPAVPAVPSVPSSHPVTTPPPAAAIPPPGGPDSARGRAVDGAAEHAAAGTRTRRPRAGPQAPDWRVVLAGLDRRRARAYAAADLHRLAGVYVAGSAALRRDRALLRRYTRRGLRVLGLRMSFAGISAERVAADRVALRVRDRVADGVVVGARTRRRLPTDDPDSRVVTLQRVPGDGWRIAAVRDAAGRHRRPAPPGPSQRSGSATTR
jgi:hypothetical protein